MATRDEMCCFTVHVGREGRVTLPAFVRPFKLGQRVFVSVTNEGGVEFTTSPARVREGRMASIRIRRGTWTLSKNSPRSRRAPRQC